MPQRAHFLFQGTGVSPGIAIGPAFVIVPRVEPTEPGSILDDTEIDLEIARFRRAVELARFEIASIGAKVSQRLDPQQAAIFEAHQSMLADPMLIDMTVDRIRNERQAAEFSFWTVTRELGQMLSDIGDDYMSERNFDLYDVARRVLKFMAQISADEAGTPREGSIIVAQDLGPADTAELHHQGAAAFCLHIGGPTSHTAILAKSLGLPAVTGLGELPNIVRTGTELVVDGTSGKVIVNPTPEELEQYRRLQGERLLRRMELEALRDQPPVTIDGTHVLLEANIEFPEEVEAAIHYGAEGIGLYRTEFLYLDPNSNPTEETQYRAYRHVLDRVSGPVTFRTLDLGGDKVAPSINTRPEDNPFLGMRAIRVCLRHPRIFRAQLRPLIRAAEGRTLRLMIPMVSTVEEIREARRVIAEVEAELVAYGHAPVAEMYVGIMVEVPSAALMARELARECDFFSIGTNDLTQYTLAVDRLSATVAHLFQPANPAVLRLIRDVTAAGAAEGIPVCVCGEMAGDPLMARLLIGMGVRELSVSPSSLPDIKRAIRTSTVAQLEAVAARALSFSTERDVLDYLEKELPREEA